MSNVTIAQTGDVKEVAFTEGMTIQSALTTAGVTVGTGREVRLNGATVRDLETALNANDTILIVGRIRGAA